MATFLSGYLNNRGINLSTLIGECPKEYNSDLELFAIGDRVLAGTICAVMWVFTSKKSAFSPVEGKADFMLAGDEKEI